MGMTGFDRRIRYLYSHAETPQRVRGRQSIRANAINRVKTAFANAFRAPALAAAVA